MRDPQTGKFVTVDDVAASLTTPGDIVNIPGHSTLSVDERSQHPVIVVDEDVVADDVRRMTLAGPRVSNSRRPPTSRFLFAATEFQPGVGPARTRAEADAIVRSLGEHPDVIYSDGKRDDRASPTAMPQRLLQKNPAALSPQIGRLTTLREISLTAGRLTDLPLSMERLTNLEALLISDNPFVTLPPVVCRIISLRRIEANKCRLTSLPDNIGDLVNLERLDITINELTDLPDSIGNLRNLQRLEMSRNSLTDLPDAVCRLTSLTRLVVGNNQLTSVSRDIRRLQSLRILHLQNNSRLTALPDEICELPALTDLDVQFCALTALPEAIGRLSSLQSLHATSNQITALPESLFDLHNLRTLVLRNNNLQGELSPSFGRLTSLETADFSLNGSFRGPPASMRGMLKLKAFPINGTQISRMSTEFIMRDIEAARAAETARLRDVARAEKRSQRVAHVASEQSSDRRPGVGVLPMAQLSSATTLETAERSSQLLEADAELDERTRIARNAARASQQSEKKRCAVM